MSDHQTFAAPTQTNDEDPMTDTTVDTTLDTAAPTAVDAPEEERQPRAAGATLEQEGEVAADYLEGLLDLLDLDGDLDLDVEGDRAVVAIVGADLTSLVGARGETLDALQELTRLAVQTKTGNRSRLMLDISGHRAARREELTRIGLAAAERVAESGESQRLAPMTPFERKIVHDAVAQYVADKGASLNTESEGEEPQRRVVVLPGA